jgi:transcriptional regulator with XRE-family HTH domain
MDGRNTGRRVSGERIRLARQTKRWTQNDLAHQLGVEQGHVSRWERGRVAPGARSLAAIAEATGRDIEFFLTGADAEDEDEAVLPADLEVALAVFARYANRAGRRPRVVAA